ncbi:hypothetical protein RU639_013409 [Aspergillus parasiticus]
MMDTAGPKGMNGPSPRTERKWAAGTHVLDPRQVIALEYPHHYIHLTELENYNYKATLHEGWERSSQDNFSVGRVD